MVDSIEKMPWPPHLENKAEKLAAYLALSFHGSTGMRAGRSMDQREAREKRKAREKERPGTKPEVQKEQPRIAFKGT